MTNLTKEQYPQTYKECCDVLGIGTMDNDAKGYKHFLIIQFQELIIARDAYWKIAGGWEPNWNDPTNTYYTITVKCNEICKSQGHRHNTLLAFPTEEMRDAFYENKNFKRLIEDCKELL